MEENLWTLSNLVTGFSIAQSLAFLYALGKDLSPLQSLARLQKFALCGGIALFSIAYMCAVWRLAKLAGQVPTSYPRIWQEVAEGRCIAILLFSLLAVFGLFAPEFFGRIGPKDSRDL